MVSSTQAVEAAQSEVINPIRAQQQAAPVATLPKLQPDRPKGFSPTDLVNQGLAAAAAAAANAAAPFAYIGNAVPFRAVTSRMQNAAAAGQSTAVATIATVTAAVSSNFNKEHSKGPKSSQAADPSEWFVCDDPVSHTRYFVIQGSQTIEHWRLNLSFDPVPFEDPALGIKVCQHDTVCPDQCWCSCSIHICLMHHIQSYCKAIACTAICIQMYDPLHVQLGLMQAHPLRNEHTFP